ncbi:hypothetical protein HK405_013333, partial [Cladochytrium tenue]
ASAAISQTQLSARDDSTAASNYSVPAGYTETFEVTQPVVVPSGARKCTVDIGEHAFANSYYVHWVANFTPPADCGTAWSLVTLNWEGHITGVQFDRIVQIYVGEAEVLRGTTDEPSRLGIYWELQKDVTDFSPIFTQEQTVTVILDNIVDSTYTGVFNTHLYFDFYVADESNPVPDTVPDVLIPLSQPSPNFAYTITGGNAAAYNISAGLIPPNVVRAEFEYVVSNHANDEFYYLNVPDEYSNPDYSVFGGNVYKELQVYLDGFLVGIDWHVPVIYTGGMNPLLWRPIVHPGASVVPSYRFELTPFVGNLTDGAAHTLTLNVTHQISGGNWFADGNLRLWLNAASDERTNSTLTTYSFPDTDAEVTAADLDDNYDGSYTTTLDKEFAVAAVVTTAAGSTEVVVRRSVRFDAFVAYTDGTNIVQATHDISVRGDITATTTKTSTNTTTPPPAEGSAPHLCMQYDEGSSSGDGSGSNSVNTTTTTTTTATVTFARNSTLSVDYGYYPATDSSDYTVNTTVRTSIDEVWGSGSAAAVALRRVTHQLADGYFGVVGGASVGLATTNETFSYADAAAPPCYRRIVSASNRTVSSNYVDATCVF